MSDLNTPATGRFDGQLDRLAQFMRLGQSLSQPPVGGDAAEGGEFIVPMPFSGVSRGGGGLTGGLFGARGQGLFGAGNSTGVLGATILGSQSECLTFGEGEGVAPPVAYKSFYQEGMGEAPAAFATCTTGTQGLSPLSFVMGNEETGSGPTFYDHAPPARSKEGGMFGFYHFSTPQGSGICVGRIGGGGGCFCTRQMGGCQVASHTRMKAWTGGKLEPGYYIVEVGKDKVYAKPCLSEEMACLCLASMLVVLQELHTMDTCKAIVKTLGDKGVAKLER